MIPNYYSRELQWLLKTPVFVAALSFAGGTILLLLFLNGAERYPLLPLGFLYVCGAFMVNSIVFCTMVLCSFIIKERQKELLNRACILLVNIPVAALYVYLVFNEENMML